MPMELFQLNTNLSLHPCLTENIEECESSDWKEKEKQVNG